MAENIIQEEVEAYCRLDAVEEASDSINSDYDDDDFLEKDESRSAHLQVEEEKKQLARPARSAAASSS